MSENKQDQVKIHHSILDWDFSTPGWILDATDFVSPPSCLAVPAPGPNAVRADCKNAACLQLPQGSLQTYFKFPVGGGYLEIQFRGTRAPGGASYLELYRATINPFNPVWILQEIAFGGILRSWNTTLDPIALGVWIPFRLTWWLSWGIMLVRLEKEVAGVWVKQGDDIPVENALYEYETYQRAGIGLWRVGAMLAVRTDDTSIWTLA